MKKFVKYIKTRDNIELQYIIVLAPKSTLHTVYMKTSTQHSWTRLKFQKIGWITNDMEAKKTYLTKNEFLIEIL